MRALALPDAARGDAARPARDGARAWSTRWPSSATVDHVAVGLGGLRQARRASSNVRCRGGSPSSTSYDDFPEYPGPDIGPVDEVARLARRAPADVVAPRDPARRLPRRQRDVLPPTARRGGGRRLGDVHDRRSAARPGLAARDLGAARAPEEFAGPLTRAGGLRHRDELVERYADAAPRDLSAIDWYAVLACFKLGIILEGTLRAGPGGLRRRRRSATDCTPPPCGCSTAPTR